jgi:peptidyl-prolyl cis-trans isomerase C
VIDSRRLRGLLYHMFQRFALTTILALLAFSACEREQVPPDTVVVIGDRQITLDDFNRYLERNPATELVQLSPQAASALLDQYLEEILLSELAQRQDLFVSADRIAEAVRNDPGSTVVEKRDELQRGRLLSKIASELPPVSEEDIRRYYNENNEQFRLDERIRVRQILVREQSEARTIHRQLVAGSDFEELAKLHSLAPNAAKGGEIGEISRGDLPQIIEKEIFELAPGEISPVIETGGTFHIFKVERRLEPETLTISAVEPVIEARLRSDRIDARLSSSIQEARGSIPVRVLTRRLPFEYSGTFQTAPNE